MELIFVRHGQGEHTLDIPDSLHTYHPPLTKKGEEQARSLKSYLPLFEEDLLIASPTKRTLQTASIWSEGVNCSKAVSPSVSPRMFPVLPEADPLPCDYISDKRNVGWEFPQFEWIEELWNKGINQICEQHFRQIADRFIQWCKEKRKERVYIVSHDGTISSYHQLLSGESLSREDFPEETGVLKLEVE